MISDSRSLLSAGECLVVATETTYYMCRLLELAASPSIGNGASPLSDGRPPPHMEAGAP
jgi:hypothetical protein